MTLLKFKTKYNNSTKPRIYALDFDKGQKSYFKLISVFTHIKYKFNIFGKKYININCVIQKTNNKTSIKILENF